MLLSLILKSKEAGEKEAGASVGDEKVADTSTFKEIEMDAGKLSDETENCANKSERVTRASSNPSKDTVSCGLSGNNPRGTTLVIAPLSLITQWEEEIASKTDLTHFVCYDVSAKKLSGNNSFSCVDVVVTTCE